MNTRFIFHDLTPPEPYKTIDTLKVAKKYFAFNSNKLDDLGNFLKVGRKVKHPGFDLWLSCEAGDEASWRLMKKYNKQDVLLLERIYLKLRPWISPHPPMTFDGCPNCGHTEMQRRGFNYLKKYKTQKLQCKKCHAWTSKRVTT
jgi:hypothetical protein